MRTLLAALLLALGAVLPVAVPTGSIEDFLDAEMSASGVPGLAYAVVERGQIEETGARGVLRSGTETPVTPDTPFLIGSISKSFTALAVMQLVEAGAVDLDSTIAEYLDGFAGGPGAGATVRQLLSHTSGYSTLQGNVTHTDITGRKDELARRVEEISRVVPAHGAGRTWEYSNTNYQVLGRMVEVVSGQEYQAYVAEHILRPLGMHNSFVSDGEIHPAMATGHRPWFGTKRPLPENKTHRGTAPQGGIVASARDLGLYLTTMMNGQDDVLSAGGKVATMRPASPVSPHYGLGWYVDPSSGTASHSGTSPGYESMATMIPSERRGVVVLVNGGSGVGFGETAELLNGITARALGFDYDGEGPRVSQKVLFVSLVLLPVLYLLSMIWAWRHRTEIRAKSGPFGMFSLWFPLVTTVAGAWVMLSLMPSLFGTPLANIRLFQPDLGLVLIASAVTGVGWAVFRLGVAYTGRTGPH